MEKIIDTIKLMAKAGLFFANCDGNFAERERDFLESFVGNIEEVGDISDELKAEVKDTHHTYHLADLVKETLQLVEGFNDDERKAILVTTSLFIHKVIIADQKSDSKEMELFEQWQKAVGLA